MKQPKNMQAIYRRIAEDNDPAAFTTFFRVYHPKLLRFALLYVPSKHQAEDVVSDTMVQLLRRRQNVFRMKKLEGYLFMSVKNQALNHIKKKKVGLEDDEEYATLKQPVLEDTTPLRQLLDDELRERIRVATERLPPRRQRVYRLVKDEGLRYRQVAELLNISDRTVEHHLESALKDLRRTIRAYLSERESPPVPQRLSS